MIGSGETRRLEVDGRPVEFRLVRSARKRVAIDVYPDGSVRVRAPRWADEEEVVGAVSSRFDWITRQQQFFRKFDPRTPLREYVSGESHLYLGRRYRLKVLTDSNSEQSAKLVGGHIFVRPTRSGDSKEVCAILWGWYRRHAHRVFPARLEACKAAHVDFRRLDSPSLTVQQMSRRWGSCTTGGRILLNLDLIRAPRRCIDYVITHELCHLVVPDHSAAFFQLLNRVAPDWEQRKAELEELMV